MHFIFIVLYCVRLGKDQQIIVYKVFCTALKCKSVYLIDSECISHLNQEHIPLDCSLLIQLFSAFSNCTTVIKIVNTCNDV